MPLKQQLAALKKPFLLLLVTFVTVYSVAKIQIILMGFLHIRSWVSLLLLQIFSGGEWGQLIREMISLLVLPLVFAGIPAIIYRVSKERVFPYFWDVLWVIWLIQATAVIVLYKGNGI